MTNMKYITPCDLCRYDPPSSSDNKPCSMCPASARDDLEFESENNNNGWISIKDKLPTERRDYLVVQNDFGQRWVDINNFTPQLTIEDAQCVENVEDKDIGKPVWYEDSCEGGIYVNRRVTHWMSIPPIPDFKPKE